MDNFDHTISLGYICNVVSYLTMAKKRKTAYVFDRLATPMWAINELIINKFDKFLVDENFGCDVLFENSEKKVSYDKKYYVRLPLKPSQVKNLDKFRSIMTRRIERLYTILNGGGNVLFIRTQEPMSYKDWGERIINAEYKEKYEKSEKYYLDKLCEHIKTTYPSLSFKVLYLSDDGQFVDNDNGIIGIPKCKCDYRDMVIGKKMKKLIEDNKVFIENNL